MVVYKGKETWLYDYINISHESKNAGKPEIIFDSMYIMYG